MRFTVQMSQSGGWYNVSNSCTSSTLGFLDGCKQRKATQFSYLVQEVQSIDAVKYKMLQTFLQRWNSFVLQAYTLQRPFSLKLLKLTGQFSN